MMEKKPAQDFLKRETTVASRKYVTNHYIQQRPQAVLRDMKNTATKRFSNIKSTVGSWSERLRRSIRMKYQLTSNNRYAQMTNKGTHTPVKLYSPFGIDTPNSRSRTHSTGEEENLPRTPRRSMRRASFASPSGRFKKDVGDVSSSILELNQLAITISKRK